MPEGATWSSMLHKYNTMKRWLLALVIVAACMAYPLLLLAGLLWTMARIVGMA
jgi:hypothetical protein